MGKFGKFLFRTFSLIIVCCIATIILFASGLVEGPVFLDVTNTSSSESAINPNKKENNSSSSSQITKSGTKTITITSNSNSNPTVDAIPSALSIKLTGTYLSAYLNAADKLPSSDKNSRILIKVGLQILQSQTIHYENKLHFYSLDYSSSGGTPGAIKYNLVDCINRINKGNTIYTDCFGYVRLTHCIACYTINKNNPGNVSGLSGLYGYIGAYSNGVKFSSLSTLKSGAVIYDCLTGSGSGERHVAMFLFSDGNNVTYMDQSGIHHGTFINYSYIYDGSKSNPYKFNKYKNYN